MTTGTILDVIKCNVQELIGEHDLIDKLEEKKTLHCCWRIEPKEEIPSFTCFLPLIKLKQMIQAGFTVTILIADIQSLLDSKVNTIRAHRYELILKSMLVCIGVDLNKVNVERGSNFQLMPSYILDLFRLSTNVTTNAAWKTTPTFHGGWMHPIKLNSSDPDESQLPVKLHERPAVECTSVGHCIRPLMQPLDEHHLKIDLEVGNPCQRSTMVFSRDNGHKIGYSKCSYAILPLIPSFHLKKMERNLSFLDSTEIIETKIDKAWCSNSDINFKSNSLLAMACFILFPQFQTLGTYVSFDALFSDWKKGKCSGHELKQLVTPYIIRLINPIRDVIFANYPLVMNARQ